MPAFETAIVSHGAVDTSAKETYGKGPVMLRIGNGGAGATGLIRALAEDYLAMAPVDASIEWVCNHSRNTQLALLHGHVDIALTYERGQEELASSEGWSRTRGCAFHDHFCLVGPSSDPANIRSASTLAEAFSQIATSRALFHSRADTSATMWKERGVWSSNGLDPWNGKAAADWYQMSAYSPAEALIAASAAGAYLLTDRSTLLRQTSLKTISKGTVFFEPLGPCDILMNSCYALIAAQSSPGKGEAIESFLTYLASDRGQRLVADFGKEDLGGFALFAPVKDQFARSFLKGGTPVDGKWTLATAKAKS